MRVRFTPAPLCAALLALALAGCGGGTGLNTGGALTGTVSLDGKPIKGGNVLVVSEDGRLSASGFVNGEGTYTVPEPPLGKVKVAIQTSHLRGSFVPKSGEKGGGKGEGSRGMVMPDPKDIGLEFVAIPDKYEKPETSGLATEVKGGTETYDLALSAK
jgi:hypothetical protein